jgi:hypothetical protein
VGPYDIIETLREVIILYKKEFIMPDIADMLTRVQSEYLNNRGIGIRRFAAMTNIRRNRLVKLFDGTADATVGELAMIHAALTWIEEMHQKKNPTLPSLTEITASDSNKQFLTARTARDLQEMKIDQRMKSI